MYSNIFQKARVFLSMKRRMNILQLRRKQVNIPQVMRNMIQKNYTNEDEYYTLSISSLIRRGAFVGHTDTVL